MATPQPRPRFAPVPLRQLAFFFVSEEERAAQDASYQQAIASLRKRRRTDEPPPQISIEILDAPLIATSAPVECAVDPLLGVDRDAAADLDTEAGEASEAEQLQKNDDVNYMADRSLQFIEWFLMRNLEFLAARGNPVQKKSVIEWIFAPDVDGTVWDFRNGRGKEVPVIQHRIPFTFQWVCRALGLSADDFREQLTLILMSAEARTSAASTAPANPGSEPIPHKEKTA